MAEVYSGEISLGENAAGKHFAMATKEVIGNHDAVDVSSLLLFRSSEIAPSSQLALPAMSSSSAGMSIEDDARKISKSCVKTEDDADEAMAEDSDDEVSQPSSSTNPLAQIRFALPKSKAESLSKASAKAKAQVAKAQVAKAKAKSESVGKAGKRKAGQPESAEHFIHTLDEPTSKSQKKDAEDQKLLDEIESKLNEKKESLFSKVIDGDATTNEALKSANKDLTIFRNQLQTKIKSLGRRKVDEGLCEKLEATKKVVTQAANLASGLASLSGEDREHLDGLTSLHILGWKFSEAVWKRACKCAMLSHLKYEHWDMMTSGTRDRMITHFGIEKGNNFFNVLLSDVIQRLLRSVAMQKASQFEIVPLH